MMISGPTEQYLERNFFLPRVRSSSSTLTLDKISTTYVPTICFCSPSSPSGARISSPRFDALEDRRTLSTSFHKRRNTNKTLLHKLAYLRRPDVGSIKNSRLHGAVKLTICRWLRDGWPMSMSMDKSGMEHILRLELEVEDILVCGFLQVFDVDAWLELVYISVYLIMSLTIRGHTCIAAPQSGSSSSQ